MYVAVSELRVLEFSFPIKENHRNHKTIQKRCFHWNSMPGNSEPKRSHQPKKGPVRFPLSMSFYLAYLLAFYLAYLLAFYLKFYLASLLAFYLAVEVQRCTLRDLPRLRSSGVHWAGKAPACAHWAGKVAGWGPAVHTELGRSQVEVQRCTLSWEGPSLRSSGAHWARTLAKSLAKSWQGNSGRGTWKWRQRWWRRCSRRRSRRRIASRGGKQLWQNLTTLTWQVGN